MQSISLRRTIEIALIAVTATVAAVTVGVELIWLAFAGDTGHAPTVLDLIRYGVAAVLGGCSFWFALAYRRSQAPAVVAASCVCALLAVAAFGFAVAVPDSEFR